jgi:hypothetical protein
MCVVCVLCAYPDHDICHTKHSYLARDATHHRRIAIREYSDTDFDSNLCFLPLFPQGVCAMSVCYEASTLSPYPPPDP